MLSKRFLLVRSYSGKLSSSICPSQSLSRPSPGNSSGCGTHFSYKGANRRPPKQNRGRRGKRVLMKNGFTWWRDWLRQIRIVVVVSFSKWWGKTRLIFSVFISCWNTTVLLNFMHQTSIFIPEISTRASNSSEITELLPTRNLTVHEFIFWQKESSPTLAITFDR